MPTWKIVIGSDSIWISRTVPACAPTPRNTAPSNMIGHGEIGKADADEKGPAGCGGERQRCGRLVRRARGGEGGGIDLGRGDEPAATAMTDQKAMNSIATPNMPISLPRNTLSSGTAAASTSITLLPFSSAIMPTACPARSKVRRKITKTATNADRLPGRDAGAAAWHRLSERGVDASGTMPHRATCRAASARRAARDSAAAALSGFASTIRGAFSGPLEHRGGIAALVFGDGDVRLAPSGPVRAKFECARAAGRGAAAPRGAARRRLRSASTSAGSTTATMRPALRALSAMLRGADAAERRRSRS